MGQNRIFFLHFFVLVRDGKENYVQSHPRQGMKSFCSMASLLLVEDPTPGSRDF